MLYSQKSSKGFTLLELLIVIAILAVLSAVTILVLNPTELLRKARDSQRISDLATVKTSVGYYLINSTSSDMDVRGSGCGDEDATSDDIYVDLDTAAGIDPPEGNQCLGTCVAQLTSVTNKAKTDGNGWVPIKFSSLVGGSPLSSLPIDPNLNYKNTGPVTPDNRYYSYFCNQGNSTFEIMANMESEFYRNGGGGDVESKDGGDRAYLYEVGTDLTLMPTSSTNNWYGGETNG